MTDKSFAEWAAEYHREAEKIKNQIEALKVNAEDDSIKTQINNLYSMYLDVTYIENDLRKYARRYPK